MNSFILNQWHPNQSFDTMNFQSKFTLLEVIPFNKKDDIQKNNLHKLLAGFYLEIKELYNMDNDKVNSRSRPFELERNFNQGCNSIIFNKTILNELFEIDDITVFYTILNIYLRSKYETQFDLEFEVRYVYK
jgi:hypothetical protein